MCKSAVLKKRILLLDLEYLRKTTAVKNQNSVVWYSTIAIIDHTNRREKNNNKKTTVKK